MTNPKMTDQQVALMAAVEASKNLSWSNSTARRVTETADVFLRWLKDNS